MIIYYAEVNGFGDKLLGIVSSFVLSRILNTDFRIFWKRPFPISDILLERDIKWNSNDYTLSTLTIVKEEDGIELFDLVKNKVENGENVFIDCIYPYYVFLYNTFRENEFISKIGPIENTIKYVFDMLFKIPRGIQKKLIDGNKTLGLQLRTLLRVQIDYPKISEDGINNFLRSSLEICKLKNLTKIYLSSDLNKVISQFPKSLSYTNNQNKIVNIEIITSDGECKHVFYESFDNAADKNKILLDVLNLSRCEELLISHWSNYGRTSAMLSQNNNVFVTSFKIDMTHPKTHEWYYESIAKGIKNPDCAFGVDVDDTQLFSLMPKNLLLSKTCI